MLRKQLKFCDYGTGQPTSYIRNFDSLNFTLRSWSTHVANLLHDGIDLILSDPSFVPSLQSLK